MGFFNLFKKKFSSQEREWDVMKYNEEGMTCLKKREFDEAIGLFEKANKLAPNQWQIIHNLACAYYRKGDYNKSIKLCEKIHKLNPGFEENQKLHSMCLCGLSADFADKGNKDKAIEYLKKAAQLDNGEAKQALNQLSINY